MSLCQLILPFVCGPWRFWLFLVLNYWHYVEMLCLSTVLVFLCFHAKQWRGMSVCLVCVLRCLFENVLCVFCSCVFMSLLKKCHVCHLFLCFCVFGKKMSCVSSVLVFLCLWYKNILYIHCLCVFVSLG